MSRIYSFYKNFREKRYAYLFSYTLLFCIAAALMFWYYPAFHKSFIWQQDGLKQHYNVLLYYAKYLKKICTTLILEHRFHLPMWDFSIGYGSDIITTFHYYAAGDPLTLLSVPVPVSLMEFFYAFLFFLRAYLGGLGFSLLSLGRGNKKFYTLVASLIYCFSAFSLVLGLMHGIFMVPVCYFPWIIYGVDRIFKKKSPLVFILSLAAAAAANFYFLYMEVLLMVFYILHRFISEEKDKYAVRQEIKKYAGDLIRRFGEFLLYGLNAFLLSAVILLPVLNLMLSSERFAADKYVPLLYSLKHYLQMIAYFMITRRASNWTLMGYTVTGALAVLVLFTDSCEDKEWKRLKFRFVILTLFAMIPFCGFMLNGFAYVVNRWTFAYALCTAMVTATALSRLESFDPGRRKRLVFVMILLSALGAAFFFVRNEESLLSVILLFITVILVMINDTPRRLLKPLILSVTLLSLFLNGWYAYSTAENDFLEEYQDFHEADKKLLDRSVTGIPDEIDPGSFYRTEISGIERTQNSSIQTGMKGTQFYFSLTSPYISDFINSLYLNWPKDYDYDGVESRAGLEALAAVKYFIAGKDSMWEVPYGFEPVCERETSGGAALVYENSNALPLGFVVDSCIRRSEFDSAKVTGRQSALLSGAVLKDSDAEEAEAFGIKTAGVTDDSKGVLIRTEKSGDMDLSDTSFTVRRNASVTVTFEGRDDTETYLYFTNLRFKGYKEREMYDEGAWKGLTPYEQALVRDKNATDSRPGSTSMMITEGDHSRIVEFYNNRQDYYCGRHDFLINLGNTGAGEKTAEISFREPGEYTFDSLEVRSQPVDTVSGKIKKLGSCPMTGISVEDDLISGYVDTDKNSLLMLSVPYSKGWRAFVDGREAKVLRADLMYMAVPVSSGKHSIMLKYETPYLREGAVMGIIGIIMLFMIELAVKVLRKERLYEGQDL